MTMTSVAEPNGAEPMNKNGKDKAAHSVEMLVAGYPQAFIEFFETTNGSSKKGDGKLDVAVGLPDANEKDADAVASSRSNSSDINSNSSAVVSFHAIETKKVHNLKLELSYRQKGEVWYSWGEINGFIRDFQKNEKKKAKKMKKKNRTSTSTGSDGSDNTNDGPSVYRRISISAKRMLSLRSRNNNNDNRTMRNSTSAQ